MYVESSRVILTKSGVPVTNPDGKSKSRKRKQSSSPSGPRKRPKTRRHLHTTESNVTTTDVVLTLDSDGNDSDSIMTLDDKHSDENDSITIYWDDQKTDLVVPKQAIETMTTDRWRNALEVQRDVTHIRGQPDITQRNHKLLREFFDDGKWREEYLRVFKDVEHSRWNPTYIGALRQQSWFQTYAQSLGSFTNEENYQEVLRNLLSDFVQLTSIGIPCLEYMILVLLRDVMSEHMYKKDVDKEEKIDCLTSQTTIDEHVKHHVGSYLSKILSKSLYNMVDRHV